MEENDLLPGEKVVVQQATVRLYDGEDKVKYFPISDHHNDFCDCTDIF